jgi:hypothetical protein
MKKQQLQWANCKRKQPKTKKKQQTEVSEK